MCWPAAVFNPGPTLRKNAGQISKKKWQSPQIGGDFGKPSSLELIMVPSLARHLTVEVQQIGP